MILHIVFFNWKDDVSKEQIDKVNQAVADLRGAIPEVKGLVWGSDLGFRDGNANWGLMALFQDRAGWQAYQDHAAHKTLVSDYVAPIRVGGRQAIQIEVPEGWKMPSR